MRNADGSRPCRTLYDAVIALCTDTPSKLSTKPQLHKLRADALQILSRRALAPAATFDMKTGFARILLVLQSKFLKAGHVPNTDPATFDILREMLASDCIAVRLPWHAYCVIDLRSSGCLRL